MRHQVNRIGSAGRRKGPTLAIRLAPCCPVCLYYLGLKLYSGANADTLMPMLFKRLQQNIMINLHKPLIRWVIVVFTFGLLFASIVPAYALSSAKNNIYSLQSAPTRDVAIILERGWKLRANHQAFYKAGY